MVAEPEGAEFRAFNRFELKYVVPTVVARAFRADLTEHMATDPHQAGEAYPVRSVYFDTHDLRFYWEKIDGIKFRRKLRLRHYGRSPELEADTPVFIEIKQRVNRVLQKRRVRLPYETARAICVDHDAPLELADEPLVNEVLGLSETLDLRATALISYERDALVGGPTDPGLRVTLDRGLQARSTDLDLGVTVPSRQALDPDLVIVEIKVNERVPFWLTELVAAHQLKLVRVSKYCQGLEVLGMAPRSGFHVEDLEAPPSQDVS